MIDPLDVVRKDLELHRALRKSCKRKLERLEQHNGKSLTLYRRNNKNIYYKYEKAASDYKPIYCNKKLQQERQEIQEKKILENEIHIIEENLGVLETFIKEYEPLTVVNLNKSLPKAYRSKLIVERSLYNRPSNSHWRASKLKIKEQRGPYKPEKLIHTTLDGTKCRSRAEVDIYNYMLQRGMVFVYEPYLQLEDAWVIPDFMFIARDGNEVIIEYFGRTSDDMYMGRQYRKIEAYIRNGWVPNENLILAFESAEQEFNSQAIARVIDLYI